MGDDWLDHAVAHDVELKALQYPVSSCTVPQRLGATKRQPSTHVLKEAYTWVCVGFF